MATYKIKLKNLANQSFLLSIVLFGESRTFKVELSFREVCSYWTMNLTYWVSKEVLFINIPLITVKKINGAGNCLSQFAYKKLGKFGICPITEETSDYPDSENLQTNFIMFWSDD